MAPCRRGPGPAHGDVGRRPEHGHPAPGRSAGETRISHRTNTSLEHMASHDQLTGLAIRRFLHQVLDQMVLHGVAEGSCPALLLIDLNRFKPPNGKLGHGADDELLASVAEQLSAMNRLGDVLARLGDSEFAIFLSDLRPEPKGREFVSDKGRSRTSGRTGDAQFPEACECRGITPRLPYAVCSTEPWAPAQHGSEADHRPRPPSNPRWRQAPGAE